ncbi:MAG: ABC transporter ATP-binding protein [Clostridia bacterium]|nr:ABC transporter ATP-binding protein [Clostridia bacterium]
MITLTNITKSYRTKSGRVDALSGVSLSIDEGSFTMLYGSSGSGKSTLLSILGLLEMPTSGEYFIGDENMLEKSKKEKTAARGEKIGFIFQSFNLIPTLTAFENAELPLGYRGVPKSERQERVKKALESVGLGDRMHHRPSELSGGEQQRAAIARAMIMKPKILLADEPTGNLDRDTAREILELIASLDSTVVMVSHDEDLAVYADRVIRLKNGRIVND